MASKIANAVTQIITEDLEVEEIKEISDIEIENYLNDYFREIYIDYCVEMVKEDLKCFIKDKER